jgi:hypothetical protein
MSSPFKSKLRPHWELIKKLRFQRHSWKEVAEELRGLGCITCPSNVFRFFKRHCKRPFPLGYEDERVSCCEGEKAPTALPTARPAWLPNPEAPPVEGLDFSVIDPTAKFRTTK